MHNAAALSRSLTDIGPTSWNRRSRELRFDLFRLSLPYFRKRLKSVLLDSDCAGCRRERRWRVSSWSGPLEQWGYNYNYNLCFVLFCLFQCWWNAPGSLWSKLPNVSQSWSIPMNTPFLDSTHEPATWLDGMLSCSFGSKLFRNGWGTGSSSRCTQILRFLRALGNRREEI